VIVLINDHFADGKPWLPWVALKNYLMFAEHMWAKMVADKTGRSS
jgi:hypothetical protein